MKTTSFWHSLRYSFAGMREFFQSDRNGQIHAAITVAVIAAGLCLPLSRTDWAILTLTIGAVITAEALNTAIETVVDLASPEYHELARRAKDIASGAVLITAIAAVVIGGLIFAPAINAWLHQSM